mmetsp:Transcript_12662/g.50622  ORF Transcript_12662/g.50622 Transcript_12662/m.50622 type:complete len:226 (+) Transcript_12662:339-1016(+)|eukprot:CAMPEP_0114618692 /NCGR_PEP_ID=MMETSP0168-20121206/7829_1 /TAXON_ID=95228 ORGANISM="Vannella sp., Strain DIVA3 517/6/12" /NCGR_SAMPLE_ID=MMETSP0168 /ASSEMBLY_ACC=CAM_ASM_000044 /LENGTH=225 /DNA_ID=CAMNT_0001829837 /DNA_START=133 /DNA_END=810 /DNA_ORIENTATION=-
MAGTGKELLKDGDVSYRILVPEDQPATNEIVSRCMHAGEPMTCACGAPFESWRDFCQLLTPRMCANGLSVGAFFLDGEQVGAFVCEDLNSPLVPDIDRFAGLAPAFTVVDELEVFVCDLFDIPHGQLPKEGLLYHQFLVGVLPQGSRRGVCKNLFKLTLDLAKEAGFLAAFAECTGYFSTRAAVTVGMEIPFKVDYATYKAADGSMPFVDVPAPHDGCSLMLKKF